jgi:hypothetical protein
MDKKKENQLNICPLCKKCQFYIKESDTCKVKEGEKCSEKDINKCTDFLVSEKLMYF